MKRKNGISLIVLVITIIVMIVLAATVIISLSSNNVVDKANESVDVTNLKQVQQAATLLWADAYAGGARTQSELEVAVIDGLKAAEIDTTKYTVTVTELGVTVVKAENASTDEPADENGGWELQKTVDETSGKVTAVTVTNGTQTLDVGTPVNYMTSGVGDTNYTGGWKILGVDDEGRLLIMSSASITGSTIGLNGTTGYLNALTTLQTTVDSYKDGTLGVEVRSVKVEDIDALTSFDKTTYGAGNMYAYENEVTYTWDGSEYPAYSYGTMTTPNNLTNSHSSKGFTYYDVASGEIVTSPYTTTAGTAITTLKSAHYNYTGSSYLADTTPAYKMIFRNADDTANADAYWLASRYIYTSPYYAAFGVSAVSGGGVYGNLLFGSVGYATSPSNAARAVVTLASDIQLTESTTAGTYDLTLAQ